MMWSLEEVGLQSDCILMALFHTVVGRSRSFLTARAHTPVGRVGFSNCLHYTHQWGDKGVSSASIAHTIWEIRMFQLRPLHTWVGRSGCSNFSWEIKIFLMLMLHTPNGGD